MSDATNNEARELLDRLWPGVREWLLSKLDLDPAETEATVVLANVEEAAPEAEPEPSPEPAATEEEEHDPEPPPGVPRLQAIRDAKTFLEDMVKELGGKNAWEPELWTRDPGIEVREAIAFVRKNGWTDTIRMARGPVETVEAEVGEGSEIARTILTDEQLESRGDDLPASLPYRGSLVSSELSLRGIREHWRTGALKNIRNIGQKGVERIDEWFREREPVPPAAEDNASDPAPAPSPEWEPPKSEPDPPEGVAQQLRDLETKSILLPDGDSLRLAIRSDGYRLERTRAVTGKKVYRPPMEEDGLTKDEALDIAHKVLTAPPVAVETEGLPDVGDAVKVQVPGSRAHTFFICGISVMEPRVASLTTNLVQNEHGEYVSHDGVQGRVALSDLSSLIGYEREWSVAVSKIETE